MIPKKFILHFVGYACTGKSTLAEILKERLPGSYLVSFDEQKWQLAGYTRVRDTGLIKQITGGLFEVVCKIGTPILLLLPLDTEAEYNDAKKMAEEHGYAFLSVELTAPTDVLLARFRARVERAKRIGSTLPITSEDLFLENLSKKFFVPGDVISFDTTAAEPSHTADVVVEKLETLG